MTWLAVVLLAGVCVFMRVAVPLGLGDRRPAWLERALAAAMPALLAALVVAGAVSDGRASSSIRDSPASRPALPSPSPAARCCS